MVKKAGDDNASKVGGMSVDGAIDVLMEESMWQRVEIDRLKRDFESLRIVVGELARRGGMLEHGSN